MKNYSRQYHKKKASVLLTEGGVRADKKHSSCFKRKSVKKSAKEKQFFPVFTRYCGLFSLFLVLFLIQ